MTTQEQAEQAKGLHDFYCLCIRLANVAKWKRQRVLNSKTSKIMDFKSNPTEGLLRRFKKAMAGLVAFAAIASQAQFFLPSVAITPKIQVLTWDSTTQSNRVYLGPKVDVWTNSFVVVGNSCLYQQGISYGVAALQDGMESAIITYPSNRVERLVVEVFESVDGVKIGDYPWVSWTNTTSGDNQKFLKLRQELTGWIK